MTRSEAFTTHVKDALPEVCHVARLRTFYSNLDGATEKQVMR